MFSPSSDSLACKHDARSGSALLTALIFIVLLTLICISFMRLAIQERMMATRLQEGFSLLNIAEGAAEEGIHALKNDDWTGWTKLNADADAYKSRTTVDLGSGRTNTYHILVKGIDSSPTEIYAEALATVASGNVLSKMIKVEYLIGEAGDGGLITKGKMELSGGEMYFDAYDSDVGVPSSTNWLDEITVATTGNEFKMNSDVFIYGEAGTGSGRIERDKAYVYGEGDSKTSHQSDRVANDFSHDFPQVVQPSWSGATSTDLDSTSKTLTGGTYTADKINLSDGHALKIEGHVILRVQEDISISGGAVVELADGAVLEIHAGKGLNLSGQAEVNKGRSGRFKDLG